MRIDSLSDGDCGSETLGAEFDGLSPPRMGSSLGMMGFACSTLCAARMRALLFCISHRRWFVRKPRGRPSKTTYSPENRFDMMCPLYPRLLKHDVEED